MAIACAAVVCAAVFAVGPGVARAEPATATAFIQGAEARFRAILARDTAGKAGGKAEKQRRAADTERQLAAQVRGLFDVRDVTAQALGRHWDAMSDDRRDEIVALLAVLIERSVARSMRRAAAGAVRYADEAERDGDALVRTRVTEQRRGREAILSIDYVVRRGPDGWRVHDLITDGVSLVRNYRGQFHRVIRKRGVDGLVAALRKKAGAKR
jgi:phospholipid transport system substrate-binding protein